MGGGGRAQEVKTNMKIERTLSLFLKRRARSAEANPLWRTAAGSERDLKLTLHRANLWRRARDGRCFPATIFRGQKHAKSWDG
jgi:hypothetical protein